MDLPEIKPYKITDKLDIKSIIEITNDLDTEFRKQGAYQAWVGSLYAEAKTIVRHLKAELEALEANVKLDIRNSPERVTVDEVSARVAIHSKVKIKQENLIDAQHKEELLKAFVFALEAKKEMLIQLGANARHELDHPELRLARKKARLGMND